MTLHLSQASRETESLSLDSLSLEDTRFRITIPPEISFWDNREENLKEQKQRLALALEQTKRRWSWFLQASILDNEKHTSLGTLGYLPLEIRLKIYELLFNTQIKKINPYWGCFHVIPPWRDYLMDIESKMLRQSFYYWMHFYYQACAFGCWNGREGSMSARPGPLNLKTYFAQAGTRKAWLQTPLLWASQSLNDEFGNWIVGSRDFHFNCPASFGELLHKLSSKQRTSLRRITIDLTGPVFMEGCIETVTDLKAWTSVFEDLPSELSSLKQVTLMIGGDAKSFLDDQGCTMAWYEDEGDRVGQTLRPLYGIDTVANLVSIVSKGLHKTAPTAVFHIPEYRYLDGGKQDVSENQLKISKALWSAGIKRWISFPFTPQLSSGWEAWEAEEAAKKTE